jgi:hypothetical protein
MQCSSCGTLLPTGASSCPNCGAPVVAPQPALAREPEKTPSFYDEYIPFTDQETPPTLPPSASTAATSSPLVSADEPYIETTTTPEETFQPLPEAGPPPAPRRSPLLIVTTTLSIISLLVIIVLVFLLIRNTLDNRSAQIPANQFGTSDPLAIYTQVTNQKPLVNDAFSGDAGSSWITTSGNCAVSGISLHATAAAGSNILCGSKTLTVNNFACQVEITLTQGDSAGLVFRANQVSLKAYVIELTADGTYLLGTGQSGTTNFSVLAEGSNDAINAGHAVANLLTIIAQGNTIYLYVNRHFVISTSDPSSGSGLIDVAGGGSISNVAVDATFNHLQLWKL